MQKRYIVRLSVEERSELESIVKKLKGSPQKVKRAQVLLKADIEDPNWSDEKVSKAFDCRRQTVEDVLEIYSRPYDPNIPVICMVEQPIQLLNETRTPLPATKNHPQRVDYEYERAGTASIFMFTEPLAGKREVSVRLRQTKIDWAIEMEQLLRTQYASADKIILVCDNLNTHTRGAFYEAFPAEKAREIVQKIEFHHTPKHGSESGK